VAAHKGHVSTFSHNFTATLRRPYSSDFSI
jgi:histone-binding protein RBBP4